MSEWEDYYQILDIDPAASEEEIRKVYRYKVLFLHPDRLQQFPERFRHRAQEQLKKINRAYNVLRDPQRRQQYHSEWLKTKNTHTVVKPKPVVDPPYISFRDVKAREVKKASFIIENIGGPYTKIWITNPDSWVKVLSWTSVTSDDELPLTVNIEAEGKDWGQIYAEYIRVKLDEEEIAVKVELETKPEPVRKRVSPRHILKARPTSSSSTVSARRETRTWAKWTIAGVLSALLILIFWSRLPTEVAGITNFEVSQSSVWLTASFTLVDAQNEPVTADREARIRLYDGDGNLMYDKSLTFDKNKFDKQSKQYRWQISKRQLSLFTSAVGSVGEAIVRLKAALAHGRAVLDVKSGENTVTAEYSEMVVCSPEEAEERFKEIYYFSVRWLLQERLKDEWRSNLVVIDYDMLGNYGWAVVGGVSTEYDYYVVHSKDHGEHWSIAWRGNSRPSFKVEYLNEREVRVITPDTIFHTRDQGMTWTKADR